jgi:hypothetical protein
VIELTIEQQFKLRQIEDALRHPDSKKEDIITVFLALQRQSFVLGNNVSNLIKTWPLPTSLDQAITSVGKSKYGISSETKT